MSALAPGQPDLATLCRPSERPEHPPWHPSQQRWKTKRSNADPPRILCRVCLYRSVSGAEVQWGSSGRRIFATASVPSTLCGTPRSNDGKIKCSNGDPPCFLRRICLCRSVSGADATQCGSSGRRIFATASVPSTLCSTPHSNDGKIKCSNGDPPCFLNPGPG